MIYVNLEFIKKNIFFLVPSNEVFVRLSNIFIFFSKLVQLFSFTMCCIAINNLTTLIRCYININLYTLANLRKQIYAGKFTLASLRWQIYAGKFTMANLHWQIYVDKFTLAILKYINVYTNFPEIYTCIY